MFKIGIIQISYYRGSIYLLVSLLWRLGLIL